MGTKRGTGTSGLQNQDNSPSSARGSRGVKALTGLQSASTSLNPLLPYMPQGLCNRLKTRSSGSKRTWCLSHTKVPPSSSNVRHATSHPKRESQRYRLLQPEGRVLTFSQHPAPLPAVGTKTSTSSPSKIYLDTGLFRGNAANTDGKISKWVISLSSCHTVSFQ